MRKMLTWFAAVLACWPCLAEGRGLHFVVHKIDGGQAEGCVVFDIDRDGDVDIACGGSWYEAPGWGKHALRPVEVRGEYVMDCGEILLDVNEDGWPDIISAGWFRNGIFWYENQKGEDRPWPERKICDSPATEAVLGADVDGDGRIDILPNHYGPREVAWIEARKDGFRKHVVSRDRREERHGIGFGDVNGDGRGDIVGPNGWHEAPADPRKGPWTFHASYPDADREGKAIGIPDTGIPMLVFDVNADGRSDIIYGAAHEYGVFWLEQVRRGGRVLWRRHTIDDSWSQAHALALADIDGDGDVELITGKRWRGHAGGDQGGKEPLCLFWYEIDRKKAAFARHPIVYGGFGDPGAPPGKHPYVGVGVGMQIQVADMDGDGDLDLVLPGKSGLYLLENRLRERK